MSLYDSLTHSLTHSCLVNLIDVTLAYSKLVEVVSVADVSDEDRVQQFVADLQAEVRS